MQVATVPPAPPSGAVVVVFAIGPEETNKRWKVAPMLGVGDVEKAVDYYVDELGFERPTHVFGSETEKVYAIVRRDEVEIHLQIRRSPMALKRGLHDGDAYIFVPDAKELRDEFAGRAVKFLRDLEAEPYGLLDFTIETPFRHRLTFGSELDAKDIPPPQEQ